MYVRRDSLCSLSVLAGLPCYFVVSCFLTRCQVACARQHGREGSRISPLAQSTLVLAGLASYLLGIPFITQR
jgi:hypothetical protein